MVGRIVRAVDFERVLSQAPRSRSAHFALHHVAARPLPLTPALKAAAAGELSTGHAPAYAPAVDDLSGQWWLGLVVPKRHARRSVTRSLLKRQMREVVREVVQRRSADAVSAANADASLPPGLWVLRLKAPFDKQQFPSAASTALRASARSELVQLLRRAATQPKPLAAAVAKPPPAAVAPMPR